MAGASGAALAAAVSNAGGLGTIAPWRLEPDAVGAAVSEMRALTSRPFAVNLLVHLPQEERLEAALEAGAPAISFGWGDTPQRLVERTHEAGAKVLVTVGTPEEGRRAAAVGADVVVAQGWESGGHVWGEVGTIALVPETVDAVAPVPVLAGGGIADGRGLAAALALGAAGVWVGTRFLLAEEATVHEDYRARLLAAGAADTAYAADLFHVGWEDAPHRALRNSTVEAWERAGRPAVGSRPGEGEPVGRTADG